MESGVHRIFALVDFSSQHLHEVAKNGDRGSVGCHRRKHDPGWSVLRVWA